MQSDSSQMRTTNARSATERLLSNPAARAVAGAVVASGLLMVAAIFSPVSLSAGLFCNHGVNPCNVCSQPCGTCHARPCHCAAPQPVVHQQIIQRPVVQQQIQMVPQTQVVPVTTYRDEVRTEYRTQAEQQTIPVTQYKTVAVDEGGYQQVWVPRVVHKQVPETVYQQRTVYRQVPHQVTQRVPQVSYQTQTTMIPRTVSRVVPQTVQTASAGCAPCGTATAWNSYGTTGYGTAAYASPYPTTVAAAPVAMPMNSYPTTIASAPYATFPTAGAQQYQSQIASASPVTLGHDLQPLSSAGWVYGDRNSLTPAPDPVASGNWSPIPLTVPESTPVPVARDLETAPRTSSASGLFVPAPSAANVFRTKLR
jgi:hypothetical protein